LSLHIISESTDFSKIDHYTLTKIEMKFELTNNLNKNHHSKRSQTSLNITIEFNTFNDFK